MSTQAGVAKWPKNAGKYVKKGQNKSLKFNPYCNISGYAKDLMQTVMNMADNPAEHQHLLAEVVVPPPLCDDFAHPDKDSAVLSFKSRFL